MTQSVRTRFSPSPTGNIHLGNIRTALFSALYAKKHHGVFILRIEDTDKERSKESYTESLQHDLRWLGIEWQEGPCVGGDYGPYWQSQRANFYDKFYQQLEESELIYPCFCTDQELNLSRKLQLSRGQAPRYAGTCRGLTKEEVKQRLQDGKTPAWRFAVQKGKIVEFVDIVKDVQQFKTDDIGDFIVRRADGSAPFLFCNAIDDAMMEVSHVVRGEDHVANTPRQLLILSALGLSPPQYAHLSMITGNDGAPLSKRHGSFSVFELRDQGYLPIAIINYLARLGHACEAKELLTFSELSEHFHLERISRSPARFDLSQLLFWQKLAIQSLSHDIIWQWLGDRVLSQVPVDARDFFIETIRGNIHFPDDALMWSKIFFHEKVSYTLDDRDVLFSAGEQYFVEAELAFDKYGLDWQAVSKDMQQSLGISGKKLFMPMRLALTGQKHGPELPAILQLLGLEKIKYRLGSAFKSLEFKN